MKSAEYSGRRTARTKNALSKADPELLTELQLAIGRINTARNQFEQVVDPMLIDCYIYELKAAQLRYQFLLQKVKYQERLVPERITEG